MDARNSNNGRRRDSGPLDPVIRGIAAGIGLASESIKHRKEKKRAARAAEGQGAEDSTRRSGPTEPGHDTYFELEGSIPLQLDDASRALDDAQSKISVERDSYAAAALGREVGTPVEETDSAETKETHSKKLADGFIARHPTPDTNAVPREPLALPVVITQRRPKTRTRGFVMAYAPVLEAAGIDQPTFLDFISRLNKAVEPNPFIQAINLAGLTGQAVPEPFMMLCGLAAKMVADAAAEVHSRGKTNIFLDRLNQQFFKPRGLVALVMTWKPESTSRLTEVYMDNGVQDGISSAARGTSGMISKVADRLKASSAESSFEWPETAPLVFPSLDELASPVSPAEGGAAQKKQNSFKRGEKFVDGYMDRRAQAKWSGQAPDSNMANAMPKPEFKSRYADPNHAASSGDLVALLTGGAFQSSTLGDGFGGDVLYLMIVNLPSEEQLAAAGARLAAGR
ncbi:uncharacterized protein DNG_02955 [Cephalotrichum gorgonifer]|uniref:Uncharacterized protein n=1 Tax=Cephalotrichum gorgonifer TaxID=2041049 RepID=A0AAE8ST39_9PEZI|nr:uncharacterized protein DNG_02955 [Cephalotrichum gorgonifer]